MFYLRLKGLREDFLLSQTKLAEKIGYTQSLIAKWENRVHEPNAEALIALAKFFSVSVDFLLGLEDESGNVERDYSRQSECKITPLQKELNEVCEILPHDYQKDLLSFAHTLEKTAERAGLIKYKRKIKG